MDEIIKSLSSLDKQIEDAKRNVAVLEGRQEELLKQLKTDYKFKSVEEAEESVVEIKGELDTLEKNIREKFSALKEEYEW